VRLARAAIRFEGPVMTWVRAGTYDVDPLRAGSDRRRTILIPADYVIDDEPMSNGHFTTFLLSAGYDTWTYWDEDGWDFVNVHRLRRPRYWTDPNLGADGRPVVGVSWWEARACAAFYYCDLPSVDEWIVARAVAPSGSTRHEEAADVGLEWTRDGSLDLRTLCARAGEPATSTTRPAERTAAVTFRLVSYPSQ
jgi:formylglycine-generating enzyme required for sulfatase activity